MKVLYDLVATQPLHGSVYHGGGEYSKAVFEAALLAGYQCDALYDSKKPLDEHVKSLCDDYGIKLVDLAGRSFAQAYRGYDTFFTGLPYGRFNGNQDGETRLIFTIHGIRSLEMPSDHYEMPFYLASRAWKRVLKAWFIRLFPASYKKIARSKVERLLTLPNSRVVTVSGHSKYSILSFFPFMKEEDLQVCFSPLFNPVAPEAVEAASAGTLDTLGLRSGVYYLGLGSGRWLKNNLRLALAFDKLISQGRMKDRKLVLTGGFHSVYKRLRNKESFLFLDYVESEVLEVLFKEARGLLYPSLNEGFGYPPLQAMKYGTPVLSTAFSAVTEVCGDAALYSNPYSESEIQSRILMLENDSIRNDYAARGPGRYAHVLKEQKRMLTELLEMIFI
ncbi:MULTISPECIES: glycosyltransferase [unclassified Oceanispirochaeta]|uniref:glycosyltransferase n=1 Tax=unclassified Oceanispirochaeta TaxID=2635722 RepID=UPI000E095251|nr:MULTISPECIES: glycosyltransferase [unclassified Oceanispirochaeta]MBF9017774.1 glycosyltransferase [Oceanispirochaeta sp. M2]NPD74338.1 glycosyltransferase [Oceanispirochaeta sp. M1]RDG29818.1 glycosyltransferase [Oceanispirochaeta sp. M1]